VDDHSVFIRPFVKVGEPPENVKVLQYFLKDVTIENDETLAGADGPQVQRRRSKIKRIGEFFKNVFSKQPRLSTKSFTRYEKGHIEEVEFITTVWENNLPSGGSNTGGAASAAADN
jgi:hypothetical protein